MIHSLIEDGAEMALNEQAKKRLREAQRKLLLSLTVNGLVPLVLYALLRPSLTNDAITLAIAGAVPTVRTLALWLWRRRVDWIGVLAVLGNAAAVAVSMLSGGNALALKTYHSVLTGSIGLVLLVSAVVRRPLLQHVLQAVRQNALERSKVTMITAVAGCMFLVEAAVNMGLALTVSTGAFLITSRLVKWALLISAALLLKWWMRTRSAHQ
jgi:hypothetical protein